MKSCRHDENSRRCMHCDEPTCLNCRAERIADPSVTVCDACFEELDCCPCCGGAGFDFEERHGSCLSGCEIESHYRWHTWDYTDCHTHHRTVAANEP